MGAIAPTSTLAIHPAAPEGRPGGGPVTNKTWNITMNYSRCGQLKFNLPT